ncbi:MAG: UV DNA damage repair endonuclease UvsE [Bradymonadales bacterium]|nr:UV DNA damage repair endonuclease UvsE [Bradymonadales bacterium]
MKVGYPSINISLTRGDKQLVGIIGSKVDRLWASTAERLDKLRRILEFNQAHHILFFRIQNDLVPFARSVKGKFDWRQLFDLELAQLAEFLRTHRMRINIHPDLDVMLNHPSDRVLQSALADLEYQCELMEALELDRTSKIQLHVGDQFEDGRAGIDRFVRNALALPESIRDRLVIENETIFCSVADCLEIHQRTGLPVVLDVLHHSIKNNGESLTEALEAVSKTWSQADGLMMIDYSSQSPRRRRGRHRENLDRDHFLQFFEASREYDFDLMLELKDREASALQVVELLKDDPRFLRGLRSPPGR